MHFNPTLCECGCGQATSIVPRNIPSRGYVRGQYRRFIVGHSGTLPKGTKPLSERFWEKVDKKSTPEGCWPWTASVDHRGYGKIGDSDRTRGAHQVGYELQVGPIPEGHDVLHHCDNPPCCRGSHFFTGFHIDNFNDMCRKERIGRSLDGRFVSVR